MSFLWIAPPRKSPHRTMTCPHTPFSAAAVVPGCVGNGQTCKLGPQCCGWSVASLVPPSLLPPPLDGLLSFPTTKCQQTGILPLPLGSGKCEFDASCDLRGALCASFHWLCRCSAHAAAPLFCLVSACLSRTLLFISHAIWLLGQMWLTHCFTRLQAVCTKGNVTAGC
jgi:hypothetical protein